MVATTQQGTMRPGYKQTDMGVIPEEWDVRKLGDIGECLIGLTYEPSNVRADGLLVLRASNIADGGLRFDDNVFVDVAVPERIIVRKEDILICVRNGSRDLIGKCALIDERAEGMTFGAFMSVFRTKHARFVFQELQSGLVKEQIHRHIGATINQITNKNLNSFEIPFPGSEEERAVISEALFDADILIASLDQLIAKKRDLKTAAMQQLLTGKQRLPGFSGAWTVKSLKEGVKLLSGHHVLAHHCNTDGLGFPYITGPSDFPDGVIQHTKSTERPTTICRVNDILVTVKGSGVGTMVLANAEYCISRQLMAIRVTEWDTAFIYYSLLQDSSLFGAAATGMIPGLSRGDILNKQMAMPSLPEQTAIAAVLSDMDADIAALQARRDKTQAMKQGMMQELLTGKIRLI